MILVNFKWTLFLLKEILYVPSPYTWCYKNKSVIPIFKKYFDFNVLSLLQQEWYLLNFQYVSKPTFMF